MSGLLGLSGSLPLFLCLCCFSLFSLAIIPLFFLLLYITLHFYFNFSKYPNVSAWFIFVWHCFRAPSSFPLGPFCFYLSSCGCLFPPAQLLQYTVFLLWPEFLCSDVVFSPHGQITSTSPHLPPSFTFLLPSHFFFLYIHWDHFAHLALSLQRSFNLQPSTFPCLFSFTLFFLLFLPYVFLLLSVPSAFACFQAFAWWGCATFPWGSWGLRTMSPRLIPHLWVQDGGVKELSGKEIKGYYCMTWCSSCVTPSPAAPQRCLHLKELRSLSSPLHPRAQECTPCWPSLIGKWKPLEGHSLPSCKSACGLKGYFMRCLCILDPLYFFPAVKPEAVLHSSCSKPGLWDPESQGHCRLSVGFRRSRRSFHQGTAVQPMSVLPRALLPSAKSPVRRQVRLVWQSFVSLPLQCAGTVSLGGFLSAASRGQQLFQTLCPLSGPQLN